MTVRLCRHSIAFKCHGVFNIETPELNGISIDSVWVNEYSDDGNNDGNKKEEVKAFEKLHFSSVEQCYSQASGHTVLKYNRLPNANQWWIRERFVTNPNQFDPVKSWGCGILL